MSSLGEFIKGSRETLGLNQGEFADRAGINRAHLSQVENGRIGLPQPDMRRKVAAALGVTHLDLLIAAGELTADEVAGETATTKPTTTNQRRSHHIAALAREAAWTEPRMSIAQALFAAWRTEDTREQSDDF